MRHWVRRPPVVVFLVALLIYGVSPVVSNGDSYLAVPTTMSVLYDADLDLDEYLGPGTDGGNGWLQRPDGKKAKMDDGRRTLVGVGFMIFLLNCMGLGIAAAALMIQKPS